MFQRGPSCFSYSLLAFPVTICTDCSDVKNWNLQCHKSCQTSGTWHRGWRCVTRFSQGTQLKIVLEQWKKDRKVSFPWRHLRDLSLRRGEWGLVVFISKSIRIQCFWACFCLFPFKFPEGMNAKSCEKPMKWNFRRGEACAQCFFLNFIYFSTRCTKRNRSWDENLVWKCIIRTYIFPGSIKRNCSQNQHSSTLRLAVHKLAFPD